MRKLLKKNCNEVDGKAIVASLLDRINGSLMNLVRLYKVVFLLFLLFDLKLKRKLEHVSMINEMVILNETSKLLIASEHFQAELNVYVNDFILIVFNHIATANFLIHSDIKLKD
ncbi:CLUMA_CG001463, isoform A [Clunio marinus]|uniref:CLUMA_CG001463, isoform A n=1 Tax=Clunio marinus TaxID=568069 RepID=A0A1J1HMI5_9DIPT|nr:CLUMA_CG001463, isoform A [Clunio marinus]